MSRRTSRTGWPASGYAGSGASARRSATLWRPIPGSHFAAVAVAGGCTRMPSVSAVQPAWPSRRKARRSAWVSAGMVTTYARSSRIRPSASLCTLFRSNRSTRKAPLHLAAVFGELVKGLRLGLDPRLPSTVLDAHVLPAIAPAAPQSENVINDAGRDKRRAVELALTIDRA